MQKNHNCIKVNESLYIALAGVSESIGLSVFIFSHFFFFFFNRLGSVGLPNIAYIVIH